jgi:hypothetical protein
MRQLASALTSVWRERLGQTDGDRRPLRIPFVDFARGDGVGVGPGQENTWTANLIDETTSWVSEYRGLWGLYARDPISGENAPAGPMYERDGTPRPAWIDPLGFADLARVAPPPQELPLISAELERLTERRRELDERIDEATLTLREVGARLEATQGRPHLAHVATSLEAEVAVSTSALTALRCEKSEDAAVIEGLQRRLSAHEVVRGDPRAHIRHAAEPVPLSTMRFNQAAELWAAISLSILLVGLAILLLVSPGNAWAEAIALILVLIVGEAVLRGTYVRTINRVAVILALIAVGVLIVQFADWVAVTLLLILAVFLLYQRFEELRA